MTPAEFVKRIKDGKVEAMGGGLEGDVLVSRMGKLDLSDLDAVTAEAFNQGVKFEKELDWDSARKQIEDAVAGEKWFANVAQSLADELRNSGQDV